MDLVSMKLPKREKTPEPTMIDSRPEYPWGLQLNLQDEQLKALSIDELPKVGDTYLVTARVKVQSVRESSDQSKRGTKEHRSVELQITEMALESEKAKDNSDEAKAARMFGGGEKKA